MDLFTFILLGLAVFYWWDSSQAKETARMAARSACAGAEVSFLDDTVALAKLWLVRNERGTVVFYRKYRFEFTSDIDFRYSGEVILFGRSVEQVSMEPYRMN